MSLSVTLADANILVSRTLRDYFVYAARLGAFDIRWSETILDETARNLIKSYGILFNGREYRYRFFHLLLHRVSPGSELRR